MQLPLSKSRLPARRPVRTVAWAVALLAATAAGLGTARRAWSQGPAAEPFAPARPRPILLKGSLSNGLRLYSRSNDSSEIVSVVCLVKAGLPDEREDQAGLAALTAECLLRGTTTHTTRAFEQALLNAGGNVRALPGFDFTEISVVASRRQFEAAIKLIGDMVSHPRFEQEDVDLSKEILKRRAAALQDDFTGASYQSLTAQIYPRSPYGRAINGYARTLERLTPADVRKFWQACYVQNRMVVTVVGDVEAAAGMNAAQKAFQDVPFQPGNVTAPPPQDVLGRPRTELLQRPGPAAQIMAGFLAPGATRDGYPVYAVLDAIVGGGKRGRFFSNIREKQSLGYEMGTFYQPLLYQSHLVAYVITPPYRTNPRTQQPESVIDLVKEKMLEQYRTIALSGPTEAELVRARNYAVGRYALRQERTRDQAKWLAWNIQMGLGPDFDQFFAQRAPLVTKEQVQAAAKRVVDQYALVVTLPAADP